jgi:adenylate kinase
MSRGDLIFMGPPGSGKGTQAKTLVRTLGYVQLSTGELFRDNVDRNTDLGRQVRQYLDRGEYVPDDITVQMVRTRLAEIPEGQRIVFDGFPRTEAQAEALDRILDEIGRRVDAVILLDVPKEEIINRLLKRSAEQGRTDDTPDIMGKRFDTYEQQTKPLVDFYERERKVRHVNGVGDVDEIAARVKDAAIPPDIIE